MPPDLEQRLALFMQGIESELRGMNANLTELKTEQQRLNMIILGDGDTKPGLKGHISILDLRLLQVDAWMKRLGAIALLPVGALFVLAVNQLFGHPITPNKP